MCSVLKIMPIVNCCSPHFGPEILFKFAHNMHWSNDEQRKVLLPNLELSRSIHQTGHALGIALRASDGQPRSQKENMAKKGVHVKSTTDVGIHFFSLFRFIA